MTNKKTIKQYDFSSDPMANCFCDMEEKFSGGYVCTDDFESMKSDYQECINKALIYFDDTMKHVAKFPLQDYQNANELGILLRTLAKKGE